MRADRDDGTGLRVRVSGSHFPVTVLGPGRRLGIWLQGCPLACAGCVSRHTWDPTGGHDTTVGALLELWRAALAAGAEGLTVSGGEPLAQPEALTALLAGAARERGAVPADLLLYTGYSTVEVVADQARLGAVRHADALVSGRYVAVRPTDLVWRGSANQRLVPRTALGTARYGPHLTRRATDPTLQAVGLGSAVALLGVPRPGELAELEAGLSAAGTVLTEASWRAGEAVAGRRPTPRDRGR
ncbi:4Fe-4S single cluster domain-containing protein [Streptomyces sp. DSM 44915]|uniref:4Fe-4S single cluster domain-containing protein n=1 Tax=Streptomyces chisholmiae TaxID=3075540 RepID=A0ABU2JVJ4_9ACTN|nr:4Fe-4S single cluster domain-containing protein [Streptomyces sp. DSM 44915]MDT0269005.1 4Fe-4S single cluster domain-containing protein [Streptomyces sp. DSM 44915]